MKNGDLPAAPTIYADMGLNGQREIYCDQVGLTKREMFCLHHGVAATGDAELDSIITKGNLQKASMAAMQGLIASGATYKGSTTNRNLLAADAVAHADALLEELELKK